MRQMFLNNFVNSFSYCRFPCEIYLIFTHQANPLKTCPETLLILQRLYCVPWRPSVLSQRREERRATWTECNQSMLISNLREAVAIKKKNQLLAFYALGRSVAGVVAARLNRQTKQLFAILSPLNLQSCCQLRAQTTRTRRPVLFIHPFVLKQSEDV